jgi:hypothetical protein
MHFGRIRHPVQVIVHPTPGRVGRIRDPVPRRVVVPRPLFVRETVIVIDGREIVKEANPGLDNPSHRGLGRYGDRKP